MFSSPKFFLSTANINHLACLSYFASFFVPSVCRKTENCKSTPIAAKAEAPKNKSVNVRIDSDFIPQGWITRHIERVKFTSSSKQHQMENIKNPKQKITCCWCFMELLLRRRHNFPSFLPRLVHKILRVKGRASTTSPERLNTASMNIKLRYCWGGCCAFTQDIDVIAVNLQFTARFRNYMLENLNLQFPQAFRGWKSGKGRR